MPTLTWCTLGDWMFGSIPHNVPEELSAIWSASVRVVRNAGVGMTGTPAATVVYWLLSVTALLRPAFPRAAARPTVTVSSLTNVIE